MRFSVAAALTALAACTATTGPLADLSELRADLAVIQTVFAAPVVRSTGIFSYGLPLPAPPSGGPLIPDSLLGKTFASSCPARTYAVTADTGAPRTGVRFQLYQLAADGSIACPTMLIGNLDVSDASTPAARAVRAVATGSDGTPFVDYTLTRSVTDPAGTSSASGFVSDGHEQLAFQWATHAGAVFNSSVSTLALSDSARDFHAVAQNSAQMGVDTYSDDLDLTLRQPDLLLELKGSTAWFNTYQSWHEVITVNSEPFANVGGGMVPEGGRPTITPAGGFPFTSAEREVLLEVVDTPGNLASDLSRLLGAASRLVNAR